MAVRKLGNKYQADVTSRRLNIRVRRSFKTRKEAVEEEARIKLEFKNSRLPRVGIEQALKEYLEGEAKSLKDIGSVKSKARAIRPYIQGKTFDDIGQVAGQIKKDMLAQGLKAATINRRLALLKRLQSLAHEWQWIESIRKITLLSGETTRHFYLTYQQVETLAERCPKTGFIIRIAAYTGLRRGELFKLTQSHIVGDFIALQADTKTARPRLVPIPEQIKEDIKRIPLDPALDYILRLEWEAARHDMPHIRFHDLRHSYASFLAQAGSTLQQIGLALGHSTTTQTSRYSHLLPEGLKDISKQFASMAASANINGEEADNA